MNGKKKLKMALDHQPGVVPVDFGATSVSGMHCSVVEGLRQYYGLEDRPVKVHEPYQMLGMIEEDLQEVLGIDTVGVFPRNTMFGFPLSDWKEWRTPWGQDVLVSKNFNTTEEGNDILIYPEGDVSVPPSARMPEGSYFFDTIIRQPDFDETDLNPEDNLEEFKAVSEEDLAYYQISCTEAEKSGKAVVASFGGTGFGDIALVPAPFLKHPKGIRDITEWYMSTGLRPDYIHAIFEKQCETALFNLNKIHQVVGNIPDAVFICGTDFGTQTSQFCSLDAFRELYAPYYKKINDWIHHHTTWKTFKHSCGAVEPFITELINCGFDILNPVQCSATGMSPADLKTRYGSKLTFWGGGVDTQKTLPFGSADDVRKEVRERLEVFSNEGGFVFDAIHNVQAGTPVANVVAMIETVKSFNQEHGRG
ncbi:MAG: uroporphyrinogen decarboxylase family protein [Spirochaetales bacterium]|nr:uroporphyrinogen decarboxylase family protein [Spirochaetales bacterium]